jgi:hypothetical protein
MIWKHRKQCVFQGKSHNIVAILVHIIDEVSVWSSARTKDLSFLQISAPPPPADWCIGGVGCVGVMLYGVLSP